MEHIIYGMHSGDFRYRYVGLTAKGLRHRLAQHKNAAISSVTPLYTWIRSVGREFMQLEALDFVENAADGRLFEQLWIKRLSGEGFELLNVHVEA
jgi:hypothetical protein